jgi:two-component system chemotaxis response regulator CheY
VLEKKPDIVLMDIIMPLKSGIQATKEILEKNAKQKIIALSTEDSETMIMRALEAGCCDYIVKPFNREKLIQAINKAVQLEGGAQ